MPRTLSQLLSPVTFLPNSLGLVPPLISELHPALQQFARDDNLCIHHRRLVVRQSLQSGTSLLLIIAPSSFRRIIFNAFHSSPIGGHFGICKTLSVFECASGLVVVKTLSIGSRNA